MWRRILLTVVGIHIFLLQNLVTAQERSIPVAAAIIKNENATTEKPGPVLTGDPQKDYIHDPNLPHELNGFDLSDYPFYNRLPENMHNFTCDGRHDGFYASIPHKCQVYHHCLFGKRFDFLCANYTAFDQSNFICHFASVVDCKHSELYYYRNEALYVDPTTPPPPPPPKTKVKIVYRDRPVPKGRPTNTKKSQPNTMKNTDDYYYYYEDNPPAKNTKEDSYYYYDELSTTVQTTAATTTTSTTTNTPIPIRIRFPNLTRQRTRQGLQQIPRNQGLGEANQAPGHQQLRRRPGKRRRGGKRPRRKKTTTTTTTTTTTPAPEYYDYYDDDYYYYYDDEVPSSSSTTTTTTTTSQPPVRQRRPGTRRRRPHPWNGNRQHNRRRLANPPAEEERVPHPGPRGGEPVREEFIEDPADYEDIPNEPPIKTADVMKELMKETILEENPTKSIRRSTLARRTGAFRRPTSLRRHSES